MKKEDAIKYLQQLYPNGGHCWLDEQRIEAIGMAVKALQEEPVSEDLEDVQQTIIYNGEVYTRCYKDELDAFACKYPMSVPKPSKRYAKYSDIDLTIAIKEGAKWQKAKDESCSKDLGDYINELSKQFPEVSFAKLSRIAVRVAKWQKEQDQSTIELAEDHAYFAGRTKTIDEMMEKAVETTFNVSLPSGLYDKLCVKGCKEGDKLLVIKKD